VYGNVYKVNSALLEKADSYPDMLVNLKSGVKL